MSVYPKSGHTEHPPMALSVPWDPSWEAKTIKKPWKNTVFHKFTKKQVFWLKQVIMLTTKLWCS